MNRATLIGNLTKDPAADTERCTGVYVYPCGAAAVRRPKRRKASGLFQRRMLAGVSGQLRQILDKGQQSRGARQHPEPQL